MEKKKQKLNKGKRKLEYIIVSVRKFNLVLYNVSLSMDPIKLSSTQSKTIVRT